MKTIVMAPFTLLLLTARLARAQDVQVLTDKQGVQTYTNLPASQRAAHPPAKDSEGVRTYTNVPPGSLHKSHRQSQEAVEERTQAPAGACLPHLPSRSRRHHPNSRPKVRLRHQGPGRLPASSGQWVYTDQYGWVWMPYGAKYVSEGSTGDETPYAYIYEPSDGWTWLAAPWVWGWGAYPYFGALGPGRFGWYTGLVHAGYGWGSYRGGGPGHVGFARGNSIGHRGGTSFGGGGHYGRGFSVSRGGGLRSSGGFHTGPATRRGSLGGGEGFSGGHGGGGGFAGGHSGGGGRRWPASRMTWRSTRLGSRAPCPSSRGLPWRAAPGSC